MFLGVEEWKYNPRAPSGPHVLKHLPHSFPDNKLVEDSRNVLRRKLKSRMNEMQRLVTESRALEARNIPMQFC